MPEMRFRVRLPDGREENYYSPSLVVRELMSEGVEYPMFEFLSRARAALTIAAERVRVKYGFPCSIALSELRRLDELARAYHADQRVRVCSFDA